MQKRSFDGKPGARPSRPSGDKKPFSKPAPGGEKKQPLAKLSKKERKEKKMEKKIAKKPSLSHLPPAMKLWEALRPESVSNEEKRKGIRQMYDEVKGTIAELSTNHHMSRVIQFMLAHGDKEITGKVAVELEGKILELCESTFGHFIVKKMIENASKDKEKEKLSCTCGTDMRRIRIPCPPPCRYEVPVILIRTVDERIM